VWETLDQEGRRVVLTESAWAHVLRNHPQIEVDPAHLMTAVASPTRRIRGRELSEEWCYREGFGPSRWLKVVVHYEGDVGRVATAFPRRAFP